MSGTSTSSGDPDCSAPRLDSAEMGELANNIVLVSSGSHSGLGLVVGWKPPLGEAPGEACAAVPAHVVYGQDRTPSHSRYRSQVLVRFAGEPPMRLSRDPLFPQGDADLTFVCFDWDGRHWFHAGLIPRAMRPGDPLQLIGEPGLARISQVRGTLVGVAPNVSISSGADVSTTGLNGVKGQSGSLVASPRGVVGLYLGAADNGYALSLRAIEGMARTSNVLWQLTEARSFDCTIHRRCCPVTHGTPASPSIAFENLAGGVSATVDIGSCADLAEGSYELRSTSNSLVCEPRSLDVYGGAAPLEVLVSCALRLDGTWQSPEGAELYCLGSVQGVADCAGLATLGLGAFEGRLVANGARVSLSGTFAGFGASGDLHWSAGRLTGEIRRQNQSPIVLNLKRAE